ncbi:hypothetical protein LE181_05530 [Streptomyces sp. SCA3-4]|uniref:DUF6255 family natural product biosynthesis protein n=1 Tax=Streptomyces sichuanensis TaxID=2871810 RepID=UPI001CE32EBB|nr:DUF6255 family natural product biosynthesis protein [Streptomyces sichuanensis]MCA6091626.1 hypothetical protein [Streptomyces sichuanensis]
MRSGGAAQATGRLAGGTGSGRTCPHPAAAWTTAGGLRTCARCGTRRVTDYRALGLALQLPDRGELDGPTVAVRGTGTLTGPGGRRSP